MNAVVTFFNTLGIKIYLLLKSSSKILNNAIMIELTKIKEIIEKHN